MTSLKKSDIKLTASLNAVIAQYHNLPYTSRYDHLIDRVASLNENNVAEAMKELRSTFSHRHLHFEDMLLRHFNHLEINHGHDKSFNSYSTERKLLLGSYVTKEYSFQSAALFNPSIVAHPDQHNLKDGELRFVMSLRATGEGHISSILFRTGIITENGTIKLDEISGYYTPLKPITPQQPNSVSTNCDLQIGLPEINYDLIPFHDLPMTEKVLFPTALSERNGMEDLRMVKFTDGDNSVYYGTYTAYDGIRIRTMLMETDDFNTFRIRSIHGDAIDDKGMALFPEKINGRYVICSRQGSEILSIMFSEDLYQWNSYQLLTVPLYDWEFVQIGNCGSPIKTKRGWLLLTHGVGPMRKYMIGAILLDLKDPTKIIGRLKEPLLSAGEIEREGYVPNVVYTCGAMLHGKWLIIPYAISDTSTVVASVELEEILNAMV